MAEMLDYYDPQGLSTVFYDLVTRHDGSLQGDLDFYADLIPPQSWVLELGCGTGRITLPLAMRDYAVVGLDLSEAMLARAAARHAAAEPELKARTAFVGGDMRHFDLNHQFDAVIAPFFGFSHLAPGQDRAQAMRSIARHLRPGGIAAIHAVHPQTIRDSAPLDPTKPVLNVAYDEAGRRLAIFMRGQSFDEGSGRFEQVLDYVRYDAGGREESRSPERLTYFVSDLEGDAQGSGLTLERKITPFQQVGEMWVFKKA